MDSWIAGPPGFVPLLFAGIVLAGCSSAPPVAPADTRSVVNPARSDRGNPPFYEVFGQRYYVLDSSDGYRERGIASWYGREFHGRPTSGGDIYDMNALTAAHKTLPIPTWVEVTNLGNGKQVIVKVNDRGPFVDGRVIDLSRRAAQELEMIGTGTARVQVRALGAPVAAPPVPVLAGAEPEPRRGTFSIISEARADSLGPGDRPFRPLYVQVGAFAERQNAASLAERLKQGGFVNTFVLTSGQGSDRIHRVRIGPIEDEAHFDRLRADLSAVGVHDSRLVQDN
jgi:rare lipoprotein A